MSTVGRLGPPLEQITPIPIEHPASTTSSRQNFGLLAGIVIIAFNLRPALAAVGPVVADIAAATGLSTGALGALTTLPLLAFGCVSVFAPSVSQRLGISVSLAVALGLLVFGSGLRVLATTSALFLGTAILGVGIALGNVLLPALIKQSFPDRAGALTSVYASAMGVGAAAAAGLSVPLATAMGWRAALGMWGVAAALALLCWLPQVRASARPAAATQGRLNSMRQLLKSRLVWSVSLFMGMQSLVFYVVLAWLPSLFQARGMSAEASGWMLALSQVGGILGAAAIPLWAGRLASQRRVIALIVLLDVVAIAGLLSPALGLAQGVVATAWWVTLQGFGLGGGFALALLLLVVRAGDAPSAAALSGVAQSIGYLVAATGPVLFGALHDATGSWDIVLLAVGGVMLAKAAIGWQAARDRQITLAQLTP